MSSQQMSIDAEAVAAAVNQIDIAIEDINTRNAKFISLLTDTNSKTKGKFTLIKTLQERVEDEAKNINETIKATEEIKAALRKYTDMAEEANDDSAFRA